MTEHLAQDWAWIGVFLIVATRGTLRVPQRSSTAAAGVYKGKVRMMGQRLEPSSVRRKVRRMAGKMAAETASTKARSTELG